MKRLLLLSVIILGMNSCKKDEIVKTNKDCLCGEITSVVEVPEQQGLVHYDVVVFNYCSNNALEFSTLSIYPIGGNEPKVGDEHCESKTW